MKLIGDVEDFLTWAMRWASRHVRGTDRQMEETRGGGTGDGSAVAQEHGEPAPSTPVAPVAVTGPTSDQASGERQPKLGSRKENILEAMLALTAVDRDSRRTRSVIVNSINPKDTVPRYRRAFDGLADAGYTQGEPGVEGGIWLTPLGRARAEEVKRRNDATDK
jgi:hypothetical protein